MIFIVTIIHNNFGTVFKTILRSLLVSFMFQIAKTSLSVCQSITIYLLAAFLIIIIVVVGFIERKINTNPLSPRRESPVIGMGRHLKSARQGITKVGGMPA